MATLIRKYLPTETTGSASVHVVVSGRAPWPEGAVISTPLPPEKIPAPTVGARYRHKKRGSIYTVVAISTGQCSGNDRIENQKFVCYGNEAGQTFVRPWREFRDGRFTPLSGEYMSEPVSAVHTPITKEEFHVLIAMWTIAPLANMARPENHSVLLLNWLNTLARQFGYASAEDADRCMPSAWFATESVNEEDILRDDAGTDACIRRAV